MQYFHWYVPNDGALWTQVENNALALTRYADKLGIRTEEAWTDANRWVKFPVNGGSVWVGVK